MTPDMVAELLRQLMKEAMILAAPLLIAAALLSFSVESGADADQLAGAVPDLGSAAGGDLDDSAGGNAVVPGADGGVYQAAAGGFPSVIWSTFAAISASQLYRLKAES